MARQGRKSADQQRIDRLVAALGPDLDEAATLAVAAEWLLREQEEPGALDQAVGSLGPAPTARTPGQVRAGAGRSLGGADDCDTVAETLAERWGVPAKNLRTPSTLAALVACVQEASTSGRRLRVVGSARSLSDASRPDPKALVVRTCALDRLLDEPVARRRPAYTGTLLARAECGCNVRALVEALDADDLALSNLGSGSFQTVVGALSTCTHGSGARLPPLPGLVRAVELVEVHQGVVRVRRLEHSACRVTDPQQWPQAIDGVPADLVQDDDDAFLAAVTGLGCLGAIYSVTLEVVPQYFLSETRTEEPWSEVRDRLVTEAQQVRNYELLVSPYAEDGSRPCLVTRRERVVAAGPAGGRPPAMALAKTGLGRKAAGGKVQEAVRKPLQRAPANIGQALQCTRVQHYVDRSQNVLWLNLNLNAVAAEWAVPIDLAPAAAEVVFDLTRRNRERALALWDGPGDETERVLRIWREAPLPTSPLALRFCDRFDGLVSMTSGHRTCLLELPFPGSDELDRRHAEGKDGDRDRVYAAYLEGRLAFLREVDRLLAPFGARPHWGLVNFLDAGQVARVYGAGWTRWVGQYQRANASGVFAGPLSDRLGLSRPPGPAAAPKARKRSATAAPVPRAAPAVPAVRVDPPDLRDRWYEPSLRALPDRHLPKRAPRILDQRDDPACTGFALAAVIRAVDPKQREVSARMLYAMARRHDEWPGEENLGSSLRGALRGWYHHGVCAAAEWSDAERGEGLTLDRARSARRTALGAYYRLRPILVDWHAALLEAGAVYVSAWTHEGWDDAGDAIAWSSGRPRGALHAFAVVGWDAERGFRVQNSWGPGWGVGGSAWWSYEDWLDNVQDAWVFRLAVPTPQVFGRQHRGAPTPGADATAGSPRRSDIAGHFVHFDDGALVRTGKYWSTEHDLGETASYLATHREKFPDLVLYGHGGMTGAASAAQRTSALRAGFQRHGVYPLHVLWETGFSEEVLDLLRRGSRAGEERAGALTDWTDQWIERLTRRIGRGLWEEMQRDAARIFSPGGDGRGVVDLLRPVLAGGTRLHLVGHSAGSILWARLLMACPDLRVASVSLLAPACTVALWEAAFRPLLGDRIGRLGIYVLSDTLERADSAGPYRKSILYYVSNAAEPRGPDGPDAVPILGMETFARDLPASVERVVAQEGETRCTARSHVSFDADAPTLNDVLTRILGRIPAVPFTPDEVR